MRHPEVRGEKIESKKRLRNLVDGEYSALKKKKDFPQKLKEAEAHQDLLKKYSGRENLQYGDIEKIAKELGCSSSTVSNWLTKGDRPRLYAYMEWATPRSEASEKVSSILDSNNGVKSPDDVYKDLRNGTLVLLLVKKQRC